VSVANASLSPFRYEDPPFGRVLAALTASLRGLETPRYSDDSAAEAGGRGSATNCVTTGLNGSYTDW